MSSCRVDYLFVYSPLCTSGPNSNSLELTAAALSVPSYTRSHNLRYSPRPAASAGAHAKFQLHKHLLCIYGIMELNKFSALEQTLEDIHSSS